MVAWCVLCSSATAFTHHVVRGENLGRLAQRLYGKAALEEVLLVANRLQGASGRAVIAGMPLEIPAVSHHRVAAGETWNSIASEWLGWARRGEILAFVNDAKAWVPPVAGTEVVIPYNLRYVARRGDSTQSIAYRFLGKRDRAWMIATYNGLQRARLRHGEVVLIPLVDLSLTEEGKRLAKLDAKRTAGEAKGADRRAQRQADQSLPSLREHVRFGRYVEAVATGESLLARGQLNVPQRAAIYEQLTTAYVALALKARATNACRLWREADPKLELNVVDHSPKIIDACGLAGRVEAPGAPQEVRGVAQ